MKLNKINDILGKWDQIDKGEVTEPPAHIQEKYNKHTMWCSLCLVQASADTAKFSQAKISPAASNG